MIGTAAFAYWDWNEALLSGCWPRLIVLWAGATEAKAMVVMRCRQGLIPLRRRPTTTIDQRHRVEVAVTQGRLDRLVSAESITMFWDGNCNLFQRPAASQ
jgi:hypothetical protein